MLFSSMALSKSRKRCDNAESVSTVRLIVGRHIVADQGGSRERMRLKGRSLVAL